jgi:PAS domain S-box-containing protein
VVVEPKSMFRVSRNVAVETSFSHVGIIRGQRRMNGEISVLLVDDEPAVADLTSVHLERIHDDISVAVETSVETALTRFERDAEIDCIVSDYTMPGMDGLEFLAAVRETHPNIPFILFTGKGSEDIACEAISAGVTDYLQKGGTEQYELLANRITNAVEGYRAECRADELARINDVISDVQRELVRQSRREDIEASVCERLADSEPYTLACVAEPDSDDEFVVRARAGPGTAYLDEVTARADDTPRGHGPVGTAFRTGEAQVVQDIAEDADYEPWREAADRHDHRSIIVLPLTDDGAEYGVLAIYSNRRYAFTEDERESLTELAGTVAQAIHATATRARLERRGRALAESERKYRSLIDAAPDAIFVVDAETGDIVETNTAAEDLLARSRAEIIGMHQSALHPDEDDERYRDLFERHVRSAGGAIARFEDGSAVRVARADGERVPVEINASTVEVDGQTLVQAMMRDVSGRREREQELREERAVTESLFEAIPDPLYAFDADGWMRRWNDEFASVVGYTDEEIAGMNCLEFVPSEDRDRIRDRIEAIIEGDERVTVDSALVTKSEEAIPHEFSGARFTDEGDVLGVIGIGRDVAERHDREETIASLHEATRDLMRAEDRQAVATATAEAAEGVLGFPLTVVRSHEPTTDTLEPVAQTDATTEHFGERPTYASGEGFPWRAFESGDPVIASGSAADRGTDDMPVQNGLYVPIADHGTVSIASQEAAFDDIDIELTRVLAANAAAALDRVEREQELEQYETMVETAPVGMFVVDAAGTIVGGNQRAWSMANRADDLVGKPFRTLIEDGPLPEESIEKYLTAVRELLSSDTERTSSTYELALVPSDGDQRTLRAHVSLLPHDGEFHGAIVVCEDITEQKRHEQAITALHDATREMMEVKTRTGVAEVAVETAERVLDIPLNGIWLYEEDALRPTVISETGQELFETPPTYTADGESLAWEAFERGETRQYDRVNRESNAYNPATPIRSELLVPLGNFGLLTVGSTESAEFDERDVSLAKLLAANTEAALNRAEREHQLSAEHERLTALFENVPDAALSYELVDGKPITQSVNPRFEDVFGYPTEEVIGENIDEYIIPPGHEAEAESFNEALLGGESLQTTVQRQTADGVRDFLLHVVPLERGERNVGGYSIYTDITDRKHRERELERQNELLDEFASVISHDLRNPMSVVRGRLELAHEDCPSEHHEEALWAVDRMDALIEDVLTLARQGQVIGETERVSLATVAETAWRTAGTEAASLAVENPGAVEADADRLTRLFENLFRNAVEHTGEDVEVVVGPADNGFFVADDGPGIPEDERENVFEHGYSTSETGTGLGLTIARNIVDAHGWAIRTVESETGGTRFEITT